VLKDTDYLKSENKYEGILSFSIIIW
jgi:hypothetical protein